MDLKIDEPCSGQHIRFVKIAPSERRKAVPHPTPHQGPGASWLGPQLPPLCPLPIPSQRAPARPVPRPSARPAPACVHGSPHRPPAPTGRQRRGRAHTLFCPQEIVDWFNALRAARFHYLQVAFPGASDADVSGGCSCPRGAGGLAKGPASPSPFFWGISAPRQRASGEGAGGMGGDSDQRAQA